MFKINPMDFNIKTDSRLVIYDNKRKEFYSFITIPVGEIFNLNDEYIKNNLTDFKYKLQINIHKKWIDQTKYLKLYDDKILEKLFTDKIKIDRENYTNILENYWLNHSENYIPEIRTAFANGMRNLWMNSKSRHPNLLTMIEISKNSNMNIPLLWKNIIFYISEVLELKQKLKDFNYSQIRFNMLSSELDVENSDIRIFIQNKIHKLKNIDLEFSTLLIGLYYSYIGDRQSAIKAFHKAHNYSENYIYKMKIDIGSYTYNEIHNLKEYHPIIHFPKNYDFPDAQLTIIVSMDSNFLKYYAVQLFYTIIALKKYHFHFHIIGDKKISEENIQEAENLFNTMINFMTPKNTIVKPTFSHEKTPAFVRDIKTYYACARFVSAQTIMKKLNNDVLIMDADLFVFDEIDSYVEKLKKHDVAVPFSISLMALYPWRRIMAGNVFLKNNHHASNFIGVVKDYIINNIDKENSWTLDQNALTYAYERIYDTSPEINLGDSAIYYRPMSQPAIRKLIEQN